MHKKLQKLEEKAWFRSLKASWIIIIGLTYAFFFILMLTSQVHHDQYYKYIQATFYNHFSHYNSQVHHDQHYEYIPTANDYDTKLRDSLDTYAQKRNNEGIPREQIVQEMVEIRAMYENPQPLTDITMLGNNIDKLGLPQELLTSNNPAKTLRKIQNNPAKYGIDLEELNHKIRLLGYTLIQIPSDIPVYLKRITILTIIFGAVFEIVRRTFYYIITGSIFPNRKKN